MVQDFHPAFPAARADFA
ncbi:hypothetical protein Q9313_00130 [Shinella sumterensis]|uniref:Uncharacterized protein n=1 Tax=Shinella sumterensis TaxID=1967501 RepID=A0AA50DCU0_9HYPH|nr:hypothetical protein [Shinella sumterensis]WLR99264.1 hypothetical protein Q9313_00130 [Shinella sumterensis]WLS10127.1 hypothetical protein Q9314_13765 [Shinella sumterensis]